MKILKYGTPDNNIIASCKWCGCVFLCSFKDVIAGSVSMVKCPMGGCTGHAKPRRIRWYHYFYIPGLLHIPTLRDELP
jgi:hypothetical protein